MAVYGQSSQAPVIRPIPVEKKPTPPQSWGVNPQDISPATQKYRVYNNPNGIRTGFNGYFLSFDGGPVIDPPKNLSNNVVFRVGRGARANLTAGLVYNFENSYLEIGPEISRARWVTEYFIKNTMEENKFSTKVFSYGLGVNYVWGRNFIAPYTGFSLGRAIINVDKKIDGVYVRNNDDANQLQLKLGAKIKLGEYGNATIQYHGGWYDNVLERNSMLHGLDFGYNLDF